MEKQYRMSFEVSFTVRSEEGEQWREADKLYEHLRSVLLESEGKFIESRPRVNHLGSSETIPNGHGASISVPFMLNFDRELANYNSSGKYIRFSNPNSAYLANVAKLTGVEYERFWDAYVGVMPNMQREELIKFWSTYQRMLCDEISKWTADTLQKLHAEYIEGQYEDGLI